MTSVTSCVSVGDLECEVLLDGVEDAVISLVRQQLEALTAARLAFEREKKTYEEQKSKVIKIMNQKKIKLNVGGMKFSTSLETLLVCQDSMLAAMFSGRFAADPDTDGEFFIDRNGKPFRFILDFLRTGELDVAEKDTVLRRQVLREAIYYNIPPLIDMLTVPEDKADNWTLDESYRSASVVLSNNCMTAMNIGEGHAYVLGTQPFTQGQHAWKCDVSIPASPHWILLGISSQKKHKDNSYSETGLWGVSSCNQHYYDGVVSTEPTTIKHGDTVYILLDCDKGTLLLHNLASSWRDEIKGIPVGHKHAYVPHFNVYDRCCGVTITPISVTRFHRKSKKKWSIRIKGK